MFIESEFVRLRHFLRPKCDALTGHGPDSWRGETPGGPAAVAAGRRDVRVGMAGTVVHRAGRDGANQEYLNDEIFSQPLFSPGQLSRAVAGWLVSGCRQHQGQCQVFSIIGVVSACGQMSPPAGETITTTSRILSHCCQLEVGSFWQFWSFWSLIGRCSFETQCSVIFGHLAFAVVKMPMPMRKYLNFTLSNNYL